MYDNEFMDFVDEAFSDVFTEEMKNADDFRKKKDDERRQKEDDYNHRMHKRGNGDSWLARKDDNQQDKAVSDRSKAQKTLYKAGMSPDHPTYRNQTAMDATQRHIRRHGAKHELASLLGSNF